MNIIFNNDGIPYRFDDLGSGGDKHLFIRYIQYESIELRHSQQSARGIRGLFGKKLESYAIVISYYPKRHDKIKVDTKVIVITPKEVEQAKTVVEFVNNVIEEQTKKQKHISLRDRLTYAYIRRIKKWMLCPVCKEGKMKINHNSTVWQCEDCGYQLSADEFEDDYVFWFCDKCNTYLNNQNGFDKTCKKWICTKCGYENDITDDNIKGMCDNFGKILPDPNQTLCDDCKIVRRNKSIERLEATAQILTAASDIAYAASSLCKSFNSDNPDLLNNGVDISIEDDNNYKKTTTLMKCANCGNEDSRTLWDENDTIYCSVCCHRTRKDTGKDDLIECPYCKRLRDKKAFQCCWCGHSLNDYYPPTPEYTEELNEILSDFDSDLDSSNKRFWKIRKK